MSLSKEQIANLIKEAKIAMTNAYAPYSHYQVGAALLTVDGDVYHGCNIENASYGATNCAERTAIFKAVSDGRREFQAICIVGGLEGNIKDYAYPCGICRQVMSEFCNPDEFEIIIARSEYDYRIFKLRELLPCSFGL